MAQFLTEGNQTEIQINRPNQIQIRSTRRTRQPHINQNSNRTIDNDRDFTSDDYDVIFINCHSYLMLKDFNY